MPLAIWCILAAAILPILSAFPAKLTKKFDNGNPRDPAFWAEGFPRRAQNAQSNGFEAFPLFAIAVIVGLGHGGDPHWIDQLAVLFIALRAIYIFCYWTDRSTPRSVSWLAAFLTCVGIFTSPVWS